MCEGKHTWEVDVEVLGYGEPVRNELERNDVEKSLQTINGCRHLNLFTLLIYELFVVLVANDYWTPTASNN